MATETAKRPAKRAAERSRKPARMVTSTTMTMPCAFDQRLAALKRAQQKGNDRFVYVQTRETLDRDANGDYELHPDRGGFLKIAGHFRDAVSLCFPGRV